jgi:DNA-binding NtrC family response regulator
VSQAARGRPGPTSILVVDDDPRVHRACRELFAKHAWDLRHAETGAQALEEVEVRVPTVVVTELSLPDMHGLHLAQRLRRADPALALVVLTGDPSARTATRALRMGVDDYVVKSADSAEHLRASVRKALKRRAYDAEVQRLLVQLTELNEAFLANMADLDRANHELREQLEAPDESPDGWRVLVVDDDVTIVALLETLLRSQGFQVGGANSGAEARELFQNNRYDLVLTDKNLGDANGVDLIREIHAVHPATRVLLMTGFATVESAVEALRFGAVGYLRKPFNDLSVVINRVDEILAELKGERDRQRYIHAFQSRNADFLGRYRLLKTKLVTLQKQPL